MVIPLRICDLHIYVDQSDERGAWCIKNEKDNDVSHQIRSHQVLLHFASKKDYVFDSITFPSDH